MTKNIIGVIIEIEIMMTMMTTITIMEGMEDEEVSSATCLIFDYRKHRRKSLLTTYLLSKFQLIKETKVCISGVEIDKKVK